HGAVPQTLRLLVDLLDVPRLPERLGEPGAFGVGAADVQPLVDDDVQADYEHDGQEDHHRLNDPVGLVEQLWDVELRSQSPRALRRRNPWHNECFVDSTRDPGRSNVAPRTCSLGVTVCGALAVLVR